MLIRILFVTCLVGVAARAEAAWTPVPTGTTARLNDIHTVSSWGSGAFLIAGDGGVLRRTIDEGVNWTDPPTGVTDDLHRLHHNSSAQYYASGENGRVLQALNAGTSWANVSPVSTARLIVFSNSSGTPRVVGDDGSSLRDENLSIAGINWVSQATGTTQGLNDAFGYYNSNCYAVGDAGTILFSANGVDWTAQSSGTTEDLHDVLAAGAVHLAFGANGTILRSTDGGTVWTAVESGTDQDLYEAANSSASVALIMAVGAGGTAVYSTDTGATWCRQATGTTEDLRAVIAQGGSRRWYAVGDNGVMIHNNDFVECAATDAPRPHPRRSLELVASPNPFPGRTMLSFVAAGGGPVSVRVYDARGRLLRTLLERRLSEGSHRVAWDGRDDTASRVPGGVYFGVVRGAGVSRAAKLVRLD